MQMEELKTQKEQDYIKEKFAEVKREQEKQNKLIEQQKIEHEKEMQAAQEARRQQEALARLIEEEKDNAEREKQERIQQVQNEYQHLEHMK